MSALNSEIEADRDLGRGFIIGHSFFCPQKFDDEEAIWHTQSRRVPGGAFSRWQDRHCGSDWVKPFPTETALA
jgi:hypothetical protein